MIYNEEYLTTFDMPDFWDGSQGSDRDDKGTACLAKFYNIIGDDKDSADMFSDSRLLKSQEHKIEFHDSL